MNGFTRVIIGSDLSAYVWFGNSGEVFPPSKVMEAWKASHVCADSRVEWGSKNYEALAIHCPCLACRVTHAVNQHNKRKSVQNQISPTLPVEGTKPTHKRSP